MCGIVGYIGDNQATDVLINGLKSLEYRGYDSAGVAVINGEKMTVRKENGRLVNLENELNEKPLEGKIGIGHTRWATHGVPCTRNSHPHTNQKGTIAVVHNGIIENHDMIREFLKSKGYQFVSDTDTEVIPQLIDFYYEGNLLEAVKNAVKKLEGSYALGVISSNEPDKIVAVRKDSPLIVGIGDGENFIASDIPAILSKTRNVYLLNDNEFVTLKKDDITISTFDGKEIEKEIYKVKFSAEAAQKDGYDHFMLKEIHEQPKAIRNTLSGRLGTDLKLTFEGLDEDFLKGKEKIYIIACGTAYHAGVVGKRAIETLTHIPVEIDLASEFRYRSPILNDKTAMIVISQSGETADTLAALRMAKQKGVKVLAITNVVGSSAAREADCVFYTYAGPEIAVASTKAYTTQLVALYMFAVSAAEILGTENKDRLDEIKRELLELPEKIEETLKLESTVQKISRWIYSEKDIYYLGRGLDYAVAMEASLKIKEIAYIHSDAYAGGELKHGPIAMIEQDTVVIAISSNPEISAKTDSNMKEVVARGAKTIGFVTERCTDNTDSFNTLFVIPDIDPLLAPVTTIVPLQILAYYVAIDKGCDVDKPRNLAKSVTVE